MASRALSAALVSMGAYPQVIQEVRMLHRILGDLREGVAKEAAPGDR